MGVIVIYFVLYQEASHNKRYETIIIFIKIKRYKIILNNFFLFYLRKDPNSYHFDIINGSIHLRQNTPNID